VTKERHDGELPLRVVDRIDSTHDALVDSVRRGEVGDRHGILALEQGAGHGRHGRPWVGSRGDTLMVSVAVSPVEPDSAAFLSPLSALSVLDLLSGLDLGPRCRWKWPNDVLLDGRKVAGLLLALVTDPAGGWCAVVSLGLNRAAPAGGWPPELQQRATSLRECGVEGPTVEALGEAWHRALRARIAQWRRAGTAPALEVLRRSLSVGGRVRVGGGPEVIEGCVEGVDRDGRLLVRTDRRLRALMAGELEEIDP
jgi:BirA family biotin operon repressor/biotin-[acetyl-CoA-carboxylase] ligase